MRPIPGNSYIVQFGDTYPKIAQRAYGISEKWTLIRDCNQLQFRTVGQEDIQPGEVIFIPVDPDIVSLKNSQNKL